jgi:hypothetical protein
MSKYNKIIVEAEVILCGNWSIVYESWPSLVGLTPDDKFTSDVHNPANRIMVIVTYKCPQEAIDYLTDGKVVYGVFEGRYRSFFKEIGTAQLLHIVKEDPPTHLLHWNDVPRLVTKFFKLIADDKITAHKYEAIDA